MSLIDLKKNKSRNQKEKISVDEFIEQANLYAQGKCSNLDKKRHLKKGRKFKNATFTLSPDHIKQLDEISKKSGLSKSYILRLLIHELAQGDELTLDELIDHIETK
ncbi:ribbon-helix-helix protein, CopG family [Pseudoalteromonas sp.]|uniref:ribbon-helix-helix protein, CopG family n=1 Tax=Pseudoalteromonas sp. TaxID=53249 RepID=UPI00356ADB6A